MNTWGDSDIKKQLQRARVRGVHVSDAQSFGSRAGCARVRVKEKTRAKLNANCKLSRRNKTHCMFSLKAATLRRFTYMHKA
jgi:hypothetical protein